MINDLVAALAAQESLKGAGLEKTLHFGLDDLRRSHMEDERAFQVNSTDEVGHIE